MNTFAFVLLCIQTYLIQNSFAQCHGNYGPVGPAAYIPSAGIPPFGYAGYADYGYPAAEWAAPFGLDAYGGAGEGNVAVAGDLPVAGSTVLAGQVPIMGAVTFGGPIPAAGAISITGNCACGCGGPYIY